MKAIEVQKLKRKFGDFTAVKGLSDPSLDERLTGRENINFHALIYNVPKDLFKQRADDIPDPGSSQPG